MQSLVNALNHWPIMLVWTIQLLFCYGLVLVMLRLFGKAGIFVFIGIMIIAANIQVSKTVLFPFYPEPIPLGTALFSATYLASDLLAEYYGIKVAQKGILLGFAAFVIFTVCMLLALGFKPLTHLQAMQAGVPQATDIQTSMSQLFMPMPSLLLAGMASYLFSQFTDVWMFMAVKKLTGQKWLWLRNNLSTFLAALLDNTIFSLLAWRLLAIHPVPWHTLIVGYIFGTYWLRVLVAILDTPFIYLAKFLLPAQR